METYHIIRYTIYNIMLIDEVKLKIKGGDGGNGVRSFKNPLMSYGPTGGDGGNGGSVYIEGVSDLGALRQFRQKKNFAAKNGVHGSNLKKDGANGEDLVLKVPVGTVVTNLELGEVFEITKIGEKKLITHGARGGRGNFFFRSSTNITPWEFELGHKAREFDFLFELKLIADVGLIGLPNAGKSSLLNELTNAQSKVANYNFTTLEPHLGVYYELILADIPGLIEGASGGKGLGHKFLRHISRCTAMFHLVPADSEDVVKDYKVIKKELASFDKELGKKQEYLFLSKSDLISEKEVKEKIKKLQKLNKKAVAISVIDDKTLEKVKKILNMIKDTKVVG